MTLVIGSLQLGFLYGILALGIYVTFRILNIPDLTAEGSFTLGLAASAVCTLAGHPVAGIVAAAVAGALAGCVTGVLQTKMGIHAVLAGILTMCGLYTINLIVMGSSPNISLINVPTIFKAAESLGLSKEAARLVIAIAAAAVCLVLLILFFRTHLGLCIRATGDNEAMVSASSINVDAMKITALAFSNALVAVSGGLIAQYQGFADVNSGSGMLVVGLASVIIGEVIVGKRGLAIACKSLGTVLRSLSQSFASWVLSTRHCPHKISTCWVLLIETSVVSRSAREARDMKHSMRSILYFLQRRYSICASDSVKQ